VPVTLGIPRETFPGERRVALTPRACESLQRSGMKVIGEENAGAAAGFPDKSFLDRGITMTTRADVFATSDIVVQVRTLGANPDVGRSDLPFLRAGQLLIGFGEVLMAPEACADLAARNVSLFAMELIPRITRAQSMDALSSMATLAGYRAVVLAAATLPKMFPMMMTAAGTIAPAKVFVLGAGVAGLQAIATAKRLGAVVSAYDVRPAVKEQVESVGAKFVTLDVQTGDSEDKGGYAKAMDEAFYKRQRELLTDVLREQDVVITTAAVPGQKAPILITAEMATAMPPGSLIVDIAAERGGNCELTRADETFVHNGITIMGPVNLPSALPRDASQLYSANISALLKLLAPKGELSINLEDQIIRDTLVTHGGEIVNSRVRELLGRTEAQAVRS
jgi:proton-translocating NAD(P)+ transhydrogenase subunit alpha